MFLKSSFYTRIKYKTYKYTHERILIQKPKTTAVFGKTLSLYKRTKTKGFVINNFPTVQL